MKLSWSHKMFLRINAKIGKKPWLDSLMYFCGQWLIWILFFGFIFFVGKEYAATGEEMRIIQSFIVFALGYGLSYGVALLYPHKRPKKEFEEIKELIHTFGTWKSFPSDHTIAITILACLLSVFGSAWYVVWLYVLAGSLVAVSRVYTGVHYPRDILGGVIVGVLSVCVVFLLL